VLCLISLRRGAGLLLPIGGFAVVLLFWIAATLIYPPLVQRFVVVPNQLERETEYIERHSDLHAPRLQVGHDSRAADGCA
jgi:uncharacterized membrane protein (UPF0182 family)